jgi:chorismate mutase/prephenate dehydratase
LVALGRGLGLDSYFVIRLFRHILDYSVRYQQEYLADQQNPERKAGGEVIVAYQGVEGAYSHIAATKHFGPRGVEIVCVGYETFEQMLEAVKSGAAQYGMLPIENTTAGSINEAYDLLARMNLPVVGEEVLSVEHCLVALEEVPVSQIKRVFSHPQALAQCSHFLSSLHHCAVESFSDTALAVKKIQSEKDNSQAAIASEEAANLYGLVVIKRDIANLKDNYTRFVVVARESVTYDPRIACKTSLIFATRDEKGAQSAQRAGHPRAQFDETRIASPSQRPLGISVLFGFRRQFLRPPGQSRAPSARGQYELLKSTRFLSGSDDQRQSPG